MMFLLCDFVQNDKDCWFNLVAFFHEVLLSCIGHVYLRASENLASWHWWLLAPACQKMFIWGHWQNQDGPLWGFSCDSAELWITQRQYAQPGWLHEDKQTSVWAFSPPSNGLILTWAAPTILLLLISTFAPIRKNSLAIVAIGRRKK